MKQPARKRARLSTDNAEENNATTLEEKYEQDIVSEDEESKQDVSHTEVDLSRLSRQQRKRRQKFLRQSKREQLLRKLEETNKDTQNNQESNKKTSKQAENRKDFDFNDMQVLLQDEQQKMNQSQLDAERRKKKITNKKRQQLLVQEVQQLENIFKHPAFDADPIKTIQTHLTNKIRHNTSKNVTPTENKHKGGIKRKPKLIRRDVTGMKTETTKVTGSKRKR
jgi:hypothetical protein